MIDIAPAVLRAVTGQIDWWWHAIFRPRLEGLTDEEYLWQPVEDCWTLHPTDDGGTTFDFHWPPPDPAPFTTIAWRMAHIGICTAGRTTTYFPAQATEPWDSEKYATTTAFPATASSAIAFLDRWWAAWRAGIDEAGASRLWQPYGAVEGAYPEMQLGEDDPFIGMVLHQHRELMHHGAEINLLRDLYRAQQPRDELVYAILRADQNAVRAMTELDPTIIDRYRRDRPDLPLRATETGRVDVIHLVADLGFDLNATTSGITPLLHAVAGGYLELVRALIELGADPSIKDPKFGADALACAEYFHQDAVADYLRAR